LKAAGVIDHATVISVQNLSIPELVGMLRANGSLPSDFAFDGKAEFPPGRHFAELNVGHEDDLFVSNSTYIKLCVSDRVAILVGGECDPTPYVPGTDRKVEDWIGFIDRWYMDQNERWIDPETGRAYDLLELDWHHTLGAARWWIKIFRGGWKNPEKACTFIEELTGTPMTYCWNHI
jgi:hypothetical protein